MTLLLETEKLPRKLIRDIYFVFVRFYLCKSQTLDSKRFFVYPVIVLILYEILQLISSFCIFNICILSEIYFNIFVVEVLTVHVDMLTQMTFELWPISLRAFAILLSLTLLRSFHEIIENFQIGCCCTS